ncbi:uncharacterized protein V6R79_020406 [Siganus canaliculatus]
MSLYVLKTMEGKFVTVRKSRRGWRLCAIESQNGGANVPLLYIQRNGKQLAPANKRGKEYVILKLDGKWLKWEKNPSGSGSDNTNVSLWFQKENVGGAEYYSLRTVTEPRLYISITKTRQSTLCLSEARDESVLFTEVQKQ